MFVDGLFDAQSCDYLHNFDEFKIDTCKHNIAHQHEASTHFRTDNLAYKTQTYAMLQDKRCIYYYSPTCRTLYNYCTSIAANESDEFRRELELLQISPTINSITDLSSRIFPKLSQFIDNCCELIARNATNLNLNEIIIFDLSLFSCGAHYHLSLYLLSILCLISQNNQFPLMQIYIIAAPTNTGNIMSDMTLRLLSDYDSSMIFSCKDTNESSKISIYDRLKHYIHIIHVKFKF